MLSVRNYSIKALALVVLTIGVSAHAENKTGTGDARGFDLSAVGGVSMSNPTGTSSGNTIDYQSGTSFSAGVLANLSVTPKFSFEAGLLYTQQKVTDVTTGTNIDYTFKKLELPMIARYRFLNWLSIGAGPYAALGIGNFNYTIKGQNLSQSYGDGGLRPFDFGLVGSIQFKFPVSEKINLLLDARYSLGIADLDTATTDSFRTRTFEGLGGIGINF